MGRLRCTWDEADFSRLKRLVGVNRPHTHDPLDDALEQAEVMLRALQLP